MCPYEQTWFTLDRLELDLVDKLPSLLGGTLLRKYSGPRDHSTASELPAIFRQ